MQFLRTMSEATSTSTPTPESGEPVITTPSSEGQQSNTTPPLPAQDDPEWEVDGKKWKRSAIAKELQNSARAQEKERGADAKFREAAQKRQEVDAILNALSTQTEEVLAARGIDPIKFAEQVISKRLKLEMMSPEARQAHDSKIEAEQYKKQLEEHQKRQAEQQEAHEVAQYEQHFDRAFGQALSSAGLPKNPRVIARMAERVQLYLEHGQQPPMDEIAQYVKRDLYEEQRHNLSDLKSDEQLAEFLGPEVLERTRKYHLSRLQNQKPPSDPQPSASQNRPKSKRGFLTKSELHALLDKG